MLDPFKCSSCKRRTPWLYQLGTAWLCATCTDKANKVLLTLQGGSTLEKKA